MPLTSASDRIKVLVLDDESDFLELCHDHFVNETDIQADFVTSPVQALELVEEGGYRVVVSDHTLSGMDGLQFLRALRSLHQRMPFILITGWGREELAIDAVQNGADFYMEKAGDPRSMFSQLLRAIRALAGNGAKACECLSEPFQVFSKGGVCLVSNGGERVMAAASR